ncbi:MAG TPA: DUF2189 domain-containing protein, partial [Steroidobacteraceae bacterium]|nr:DUF2189 domain-containing protein [Steroidobacteraceae bacterium]
MDILADRTLPRPLHVTIDHVAWSRPFAWLKLGAANLRLSLPASTAHGLGMTLFGWLLLASMGLYPYFVAAAVTGFLLVAPVLSTGLCELSHRLELGDAPTFENSVDPLRRSGVALIQFGAMLAIIAVAWFLLSEVMLRPVFPDPSPNLGAMLYRGFADEATRGQLLAYVLIGGGLAVAVFVVSVITVPLIIHRNASVGQAMGASLEAVRR